MVFAHYSYVMWPLIMGGRKCMYRTMNVTTASCVWVCLFIDFNLTQIAFCFATATGRFPIDFWIDCWEFELKWGRGIGTGMGMGIREECELFGMRGNLRKYSNILCFPLAD